MVASRASQPFPREARWVFAPRFTDHFKLPAWWTDAGRRSTSTDGQPSLTACAGSGRQLADDEIPQSVSSRSSSDFTFVAVNKPKRLLLPLDHR